jgi:hypothetical protein
MTKLFVPAGIVAFLVGTLVADVLAHVRVAGETWAQAMRSHLEWVGLTLIGELLLLAPFLGAALICRSLSKRGLPKIAVTLFVFAMATLVYFYFEGFHAAQVALRDRMWTVATLSVGLLPFFVGIPTVGAVGIAAKAALTLRANRAVD